MRLFIAEKKEVASAIAAALGQGRSHPGFIDCPNRMRKYSRSKRAFSFCEDLLFT